MMIRLQKFLADGGVASRRKSEEFILEGKISVNGTVITELGMKVDPEKDVVMYNDQLVSISNVFTYIMLNKPEGFVTTVKDQFARPTVMDLLEEVNVRLVPVGRLDYDTSGLLLLTNDGDLTFRLTHPKHMIQKKYLAKIKGTPSLNALAQFKEGLYINHDKTAPADIKIVEKGANTSSVEIMIHEGKNRQVRKMCQTIGHEVIELKRVAVGELELGTLEKGKFRVLTNEEIVYLHRL